MKALCWNGVRDVRVETVKDPEIINPQDVILKVALSSVCGSDLHFINGYIPAMKPGDILGHEFVGEVVETGSAVKTLHKGDRVVVASDIGCGECFYCKNEEWSLCDNSNQNGYLQEELLGYPTAAFFGCSHLYGGYAGSHAEFIRVPYADKGCFKIPGDLPYEKALFSSDAFPTGYMAADMAVKPGDIVAVWGAGGVGQIGDRGLPATQPLQNATARRVRQRREAGIELLRILNHMVQYRWQAFRTQGADNFRSMERQFTPIDIAVAPERVAVVMKDVDRWPESLESENPLYRPGAIG